MVMDMSLDTPRAECVGKPLLEHRHENLGECKKIRRIVPAWPSTMSIIDYVREQDVRT